MTTECLSRLKRCFKCGEAKAVDEFYRHPMMADGHLGKCKECAKTDVKANRRERAEHYSDYEAERFKTARRKAQVLESLRRQDPVKRRARYAVSNAIRDGRLVRSPCEVCGHWKSEAHHDDYSKPLEVRWLCFKHHRELHGQTVIRDKRDMDTVIKAKSDLRKLLLALGHQLPRGFTSAGMRHGIECQGCGKEWWLSFDTGPRGKVEARLPKLGERCSKASFIPKPSDSTLLRQKRRERGATRIR